MSTSNKFALVVGTNGSPTTLSHMSSLLYAEKDAEDIAYILKQPECGFISVMPVLLGENATAPSIKKGIMDLVKNREKNDFLLFYFAGHVLPISNDFYFVTYDFEREYADVDKDFYLSIRWLWKILYQSTGAGRVLIILDCCYAGNMVVVRDDPLNIDLRRLLDEWNANIDNRPKNCLRLILAATASDAKAQESDGHGLMTGLLLKALRGEDEDALDKSGYLEVGHLHTYLKGRMPEQPPDLAGNFGPYNCILADYSHLSDQRRHQAEESKQKDELNRNTLLELLRIYTEAHHTQPFDHLLCPHCSLADLDLTEVKEFLRQDRTLQNDLYHPDTTTAQDHLQNFGYLRQEHLTYGALLCFGQNPSQFVAGATIHCVEWQGTTREHIQDSREYKGSLLKQFEKSRDFLRKSLRLNRVISKQGSIEEWEIPFRVLDEALANALVHREYVDRADCIHVDVYYDRVEISSPGDLPSLISLKQLQVKHTSIPRNPQIMGIFYLHNHIEKLGTGIQRMQDYMAEARLRPPKFEISQDKTFKVTLFRPSQANTQVKPVRIARMKEIFSFFQNSSRSIVCPRCLSRVRIPATLDTDSLVCKECGFAIPLAYIRDYKEMPPVFVQLFGLQAAGKTTFLDMLRLHLYNMDSAWPGFFAQPLTQLDMDHRIILETERNQGFLAPSTYRRGRYQNEVYMMALRHMPRWGSRTLVMMDHAGEQFGSLMVDVAEMPFLQQTPVTILLLSLFDLTTEGKRANDLVTSYITSLEAMGVNFVKERRQLVITFNKADLIPDLPREINDYLLKDDIYSTLRDSAQRFNMGPVAMNDYIRRMQYISQLTEQWVSEHVPSGRSLLNMLRSKGIQYHFCVMSATGHTISLNKMQAPTPRRVLDPFFWVLEFYKQ